MNITILGLGAMVSRMAANLIKANHSVTVWNCDAAKADPVLTSGANSSRETLHRFRLKHVALTCDQPFHQLVLTDVG